MQSLLKPTRITAAEVALRCGVSQPTVSRILANGHTASRYSTTTRQRVIETADELGYRPNLAARSTRTGKFGVVSLLLSTENGRSFLPAGLLRGIQDVLLEHNLRLHVSMLPDAKLIETWGVPDSLMQSHSDGLLINYTHQIPQQLIDLIRDRSLPSVWINTRQKADCVYPDDFTAGYDMAKRLMIRGHRRILYIDFSHPLPLQTEHYSAIDRRAGYEKAMLDAGLTPQMIGKPINAEPGECECLFITAMTAPDRPTAVISYSGVRGGDMQLPLYRIGLRVPKDVEFAAVHTLTDPIGNMPMLIHTTPDAVLGAEAMRMLLKKIQNPGEPLSPRTVAFEPVTPE